MNDGDGTTMRVVCMFCQCHTRGPDDSAKVSHGICDRCMMRELAEIRRQQIEAQQMTLDHLWVDLGGEGG